MKKIKKFTLIELLIVLGIIGVIATLALDQSTDVVDQTRYDLTLQNGAEIQDAIVGGIKEGGRFLRDMGRLPMIISTTEGEVLKELWEPDASAVKWSELSLTGMNDDQTTDFWTEQSWETLPDAVFLSAGWRGPYINMGARSFVYDGWGNPWAVDIENYVDIRENLGTGNGQKDVTWVDSNSNSSTLGTVAVGQTIHGLRSLGRNQDIDMIAPENWQNGDHSFVLAENHVFTSATFRIKIRDKSGNLVIPRPIREWVKESDYVLGEYIEISDNIFVVQTAGKTAVNAPINWDTTSPGVSTTTDGPTVVWLYIGTKIDSPEYIKEMRLALFVPDINRTTANLKRVLCQWNGESSVNDDGLFTLNDDVGTTVDDNLRAILDDNWSTLTVNGLAPGVRKLYAYGFNGDYRRGSFVQVIDLKPGSNLIEIILTERL